LGWPEIRSNTSTFPEGIAVEENGKVKKSKDSWPGR
jgi:hypothetical protein